jgi:hypothetical protein
MLSAFHNALIDIIVVVELTRAAQNTSIKPYPINDPAFSSPAIREETNAIGPAAHQMSARA